MKIEGQQNWDNTRIYLSEEEKKKEKELKDKIEFLFKEVKDKRGSLQTKTRTLSNKDKEQKELANFLNNEVITKLNSLDNKGKCTFAKEIDKITNEYKKVSEIKELKQETSNYDNNFLKKQIDVLQQALLQDNFKRFSESENQTVKQTIDELQLQNWIDELRTNYINYIDEQKKYWEHLDELQQKAIASNIKQPKTTTKRPQTPRGQKITRLGRKITPITRGMLSQEPKKVSSCEDSQTAITYSSTYSSEETITELEERRTILSSLTRSALQKQNLVENEKTFSYVIGSLSREILLSQELVLTIYERNNDAGLYYCSSTYFSVKLEEYTREIGFLFDRLHKKWKEINSDNYLGNKKEEFQDFRDYFLAIMSLSRSIIILTKETSKGFIKVCHDISFNLKKEEQWKENREQWIKKNKDSLEKIEEEIKKIQVAEKYFQSESEKWWYDRKIPQLKSLIEQIKTELDSQKMIEETFLSDAVGKQKKNMKILAKLHCTVIREVISDFKTEADYLKRRNKSLEYLDNIYETIKIKTVANEETKEEEQLVEDLIKKDTEDFREFQKKLINSRTIIGELEMQTDNVSQCSKDLTSRINITIKGKERTEKDSKEDQKKLNKANNESEFDLFIKSSSKLLLDASYSISELKTENNFLIQRLQNQQHILEQTLIQRNWSIEQIRTYSLQQQEEIIRLTKLQEQQQIRLKNNKTSQAIRERVIKARLVNKQKKELKNCEWSQKIRERVANINSKRRFETCQTIKKRVTDKRREESELKTKKNCLLFQLVQKRIADDKQKKDFEIKIQQKQQSLNAQLKDKDELIQKVAQLEKENAELQAKLDARNKLPNITPRSKITAINEEKNGRESLNSFSSFYSSLTFKTAIMIEEMLQQKGSNALDQEKKKHERLSINYNHNQINNLVNNNKEVNLISLKNEISQKKQTEQRKEPSSLKIGKVFFFITGGVLISILSSFLILKKLITLSKGKKENLTS